MGNQEKLSSQQPKTLSKRQTYHCQSPESGDAFRNVNTEDYSEVQTAGNTQEQDDERLKEPEQFWNQILWTDGTKMM